ncbi:molybdopterin-dependent oxidoreductase [Mycobacterium mantenii]|nr:molybdopterin-dependent oxidoreductase [Mycobacterium mantenii]
MFATRDDNSWVGFWIFTAAMVVVAIGWVAATPFTYRHPRVVQQVGYALIGPLQRLFEHTDPEPGAFTEKDISPYFWHHGTYPQTVEYKELEMNNFVNWRLRVCGLVEHPTEFSLADLHDLPYHEQITQHFFIQGWSGVAKWGGVSIQTIVDIVKPLPEAKWVGFYSLGPGADGGIYYVAHPIEQTSHHLTMLAYDMNGEPVSYGHGAPLRLRNELQHGFRHVKWLKGIEFIAHYCELEQIIWSADSEEELQRIEQLLRIFYPSTYSNTLGGISFVDGVDPDDIRVLITYPTPQQLPREVIDRRFR